MFKKNNYQTAPVDTTGMSNDEYFEKGKCFVEQLTELAREYKPYFGHSDLFMKFESLIERLRCRLIEEERWAD